MIGRGREPEDRGAVIVAYGDDLVRRLLAEHIRRAGREVLEAARSEEAMAIVADLSSRIDALLCDVAISGGHSAFGLTIEAKDLRPEIHVLLTGSLAAAAAAAAELCVRGSEGESRAEAAALADRIKRALADREARVE